MPDLTPEEYVLKLEAEIDRLSRSQYDLVWQIVKALDLGACGCPDSLIINEVQQLREKNATLTARVAAVEGALRDSQAEANRLGDDVDEVRKQLGEVVGERDALRADLTKNEEWCAVHHSDKPTP